MKKVLFLSFLFLSSIKSFGQSPEFIEGDHVLNAGIGLGTALYTGGAYTTSLPPLSISYEVGIDQDFINEGYIGVGGYVGIASAKYRVNYPFSNIEYGWNYTYTVLGARAAYHYPLVEKLDTYGGAMLGLNFVSFREVGDIPGHLDASSGVNLTGSLYIGGRYYFSESVAAMLEIGYGVSYLNLGIAFKL